MTKRCEAVSDPSRRDFVRQAAFASAGIMAVDAEAAMAAARAPQPRQSRIDCLAIDSPRFDAGRALGGGFTSLVIDLQMYPRTMPAAFEALGGWSAAVSDPASRFHLIRRGADFDAAAASGKLGIVLTCQDAAILGSPSRSVNDANLATLRSFHGVGLRMLQLAHNDRNGVGDSYQERSDAGLSRLGEDVVAEMNRLGMGIDLSHCSDRTLREAVARSSKPCLVTHAGCRALYPTLRCKDDPEIRLLADRGGFFGVFSMSLWLTREPTASVDTVIRHIDHAVKTAGVDQVGFASDGPVLGVPSLDQELAGMRRYMENNRDRPGSEQIPTHIRPAELNGPDRMLVLAEGMRKGGYSPDQLDKIIGRNFERVLTEILG